MKKYLLLTAVAVAVIASPLLARLVSAQLATGPSLWTLSGTTLKPVNSAWSVSVNTTASSSVGSTIVQGASSVTGEPYLWADQFPGSDIGVKIKNATSTIPTGGTIRIPSKSTPYVFSTPVDFETSQQPIMIQCDPGTVLQYTGTGSAFTFDSDGGSNGNVNAIVPTSGMKNCVLTGPGSTSTVVGISIGGSVTNGGASIDIENNEINGFGKAILTLSNSFLIKIYNNNIWNNGDSFHNSGSANYGENADLEGNDFHNNSNFPFNCVGRGAGFASITYAWNSFDDCQLIIATNTPASTLIGNHFEPPQVLSSSTYPSYDMVVVNPNSSVNWNGGTVVVEATSTESGVMSEIVTNNGSNVTVNGVTLWGNYLSNASTTPNFANLTNGGTLTVTGLQNQYNAVNQLYNNIGPVLATSVPFTVAVGSNSPIVDISPSSYLGIGTSTPTATLQVQGAAGADALDVASSATGASLLHVAQSGVGIAGITFPAAALDVHGTIRSLSGVTAGVGNGIIEELTNNGTQGLVGTFTNNNLEFYVNSGARAILTSSSQLGINQLSPNGTLDVGGPIGQKYNLLALSVSSYTVATTTDSIIGISTSTVASTVNLPNCTSTTDRLQYIVKDAGGAAATHNITVNGGGSNIDGASTATISANYGSAKYECMYNSGVGTKYFSLP